MTRKDMQKKYSGTFFLRDTSSQKFQYIVHSTWLVAMNSLIVFSLQIVIRELAITQYWIKEEVVGTGTLPASSVAERVWHQVIHVY